LSQIAVAVMMTTSLNTLFRNNRRNQENYRTQPHWMLMIQSH